MKQLDIFENNKNVLVGMPVELIEQLDDAAKSLGKDWSRNKLIRFLCEHGLENLKIQIKFEGEKK